MSTLFAQQTFLLLWSTVCEQGELKSLLIQTAEIAISNSRLTFILIITIIYNY